MAEPSETLLAWAGDDRVTLAIVFTDIVSSTALGVERGDEHMKEVRGAHFARSGALIDQYRGREIKTIGDSVMVAFRSIGAALDYAHALHVDPGHAVLRVRAGLHIGSVDIVGNDIFGTEVAFAARVAHAIADAEIWLSTHALADLKRAKAARHEHLRWCDHAGIELKGLGTHTLWSLALSGAGRSLDDIVIDVVPPVRSTTLSNIPGRMVPRHFMGREDSLAAIETALQRYQGRVAITRTARDAGRRQDDAGGRLCGAASQ